MRQLVPPYGTDFYHLQVQGYQINSQEDNHGMIS